MLNGKVLDDDVKVHLKHGEMNKAVDTAWVQASFLHHLCMVPMLSSALASTPLYARPMHGTQQKPCLYKDQNLFHCYFMSAHKFRDVSGGFQKKRKTVEMDQRGGEVAEWWRV